MIVNFSPTNPMSKNGGIINAEFNYIKYRFNFDYNEYSQLWMLNIQIYDDKNHLVSYGFQRLGITDMSTIKHPKNYAFEEFGLNYLLFFDTQKSNEDIVEGFYQTGRYQLLAFDEAGYQKFAGQ